MDSFMHRGRMVGSSKSFRSNKPQDNAWSFQERRVSSRPFRDSQIQETSRQDEDLGMQDSRLLAGSGMEQRYPSPRLFDGPEVQRSVRIPDRPDLGPQPQREVRINQDSRMNSGNRSHDDSRIFDEPLQDQQKPRSSVVVYEYNHRRSDDREPFNDVLSQSKFMNSHENMRPGNRDYHLEENENIRKGFLDILQSGSLKKSFDILSGKSSHVVNPGSSHNLTPNLASSFGPQTGEGMQPIGNRDIFPKEKNSKAFDYLKNWRRKMNMPTDSFLLEKEDKMGNQQQGANVMPHNTRDDWYTQPSAVVPRRANIDPEWTLTSHGESLGSFPDGQSLVSGRTGGSPLKWDELPNPQNQSAKRNFESMASGETFNHPQRDIRFLLDKMQPKRPRMSPSIMENERGGPVGQYTSVISGLSNISQNLLDGDTKCRSNVSNTFNETQGDWIPPFQAKSLIDSNKFSRHYVNENEGVSSRHKLLSEFEGALERERSQIHIHPRDMKTIPHLNAERLPEPLSRPVYPELQGQASIFPAQGIPQELAQGAMQQERSLPSEMFMSSAPFSVEMSPGAYHRISPHRSPGRTRSQGRGESPALFLERNSQVAAPRGRYPDVNMRDRSPPWRKRKSPGPGRDRAFRAERGRSPVPAGRPRLSGPSGRQRSPGPPELPGAPRRERSPELLRRGRSPGPGRGRSPGPGRGRLPELGRVRSPGTGRGRSPVHQIRDSSPLTARREKSTSPGRGRFMCHGGWRSPNHSRREKSPEPFRRERVPVSSERRRSPAALVKGRYAGGRSPGPLNRQSSGPPGRSRSTEKSHASRRGSPGASGKGKMPSKSSGRDKTTGPVRRRSSGTSGRGRSPEAASSDRVHRLPGKGKETGAPGRKRSPQLPAAGNPTKTLKGGSRDKQQHQSLNPSTGVGVERMVGRSEQGGSSSYHSRGRSPVKRRSPLGTGMRPGAGKQRLMAERFPRIRNRSSRSPVRRSPENRERSEFPSEYRDYRMERDRSPYLEEVSLSPRSGRHWSPTQRTVLNVRSHHGRGRSLSVDSLQRGCSPVSVQSEDQNILRQDPYFPGREGSIPRQFSPRVYRRGSPLSVDGYASRKSDLEVDGNKGGRQQERHSFSREVSYGTRRQSVDDHNPKGLWREHSEDKGGHHFTGKKSFGKTTNTKNVKAATSTKYTEIPEGTLLEEDIDDEDLRIHLLRLREQKIEIKLMKLEEETKETELKLLELQSNQTTAGETSPLMEERRYPEEEPFRPQGRKQGSYPRQHQRSASPQRERYHRQKRF